MATTFLGTKNRAYSTLAADITNVATSFDVAASGGALFPSTPPSFIAVIGEPGTSGLYQAGCEHVLVTSRSTDTFTVTRSYDGTTAPPGGWPAGTPIRLLFVATYLDNVTSAVVNLEKGIFPISSTQVIVAGDGITSAMLAYRTIMVAGNSGNVTITANPRIANGTHGQRIKIMGTSDTDTVTMADGNGLILKAPGLSKVFGLNDHAWFQYITGQGWVEEGPS